MYMLVLFWFFLLFFFFPIVNAPALQRWLFKGINSSVICVVYSLFFHQALNAFVLAFLFLLVSKQPDFFYLATIIGVNALIFWYALNKEKDFFNVLWKELSSNWIFVIFIMIVFVLITLFVIGKNVFGSDIYYYLTTARVFYREKSLLVFFSKFCPENGFFIQCAHPPLFPLLLSLVFVIQGSDITGISYMLFQNFYSIGLILLPIIIFKRNFLMAAFYIIIYCSRFAGAFTPSHIFNFYTVWILVSLSILRFFLDTKDKKLIYALSISLGIMLTTHSLGFIFYVLIFSMLILFYQEKSLGEKYKTIMLIFLLSFSIGGFKYILNLYEYNNLVVDVEKMYDGVLDFFIQERETYLRKGFLARINNFNKSYFNIIAFFLVLMIFNIKTIYKGLFKGIKNIFFINKFKISPFIEYALISFLYLIIYFIIALHRYVCAYLRCIIPMIIISIIYCSFMLLKKIYYKFLQRYPDYFKIIIFCIAIVAVKAKCKISRRRSLIGFSQNNLDYQIDVGSYEFMEYYKALENTLKNKKSIIVGGRTFFGILDKNFPVYRWNPFINKILKDKEEIFNWLREKNFKYIYKELVWLGKHIFNDSMTRFLADPSYVTPIESVNIPIASANINVNEIDRVFYKINKEKKNVKSENIYNFYADLQEGVRKTFETDDLNPNYNYMIKFSSKDPEQFYKLEITAGDKVFVKFLVKSKDSIYIHSPSIDNDKFKIVIKVFSLEKPVQVFLNIEKVIENAKEPL